MREGGGGVRWNMLRMRTNMFILLLLILFSSWESCSVNASVSYDHKSVIVNGQRRILISGSIHYPRSTPEVILLPMWLVNVSFFVFSVDFFDAWVALVLHLFIALELGFLICCLLCRLGCRCGPTLYERPKTEVWMLYKHMSFGMDMSLLLEK